MATEHNNQAAALSNNNANGNILEKDFSNPHGAQNGASYSNGNAYHMNDLNMDNDTALKRIRTAGSISISPELFEKLYLSPQNAVKGDLRKTFGNPTPVYVHLPPAAAKSFSSSLKFTFLYVQPTNRLQSSAWFSNLAESAVL
jgi:hypothetical protein